MYKPICRYDIVGAFREVEQGNLTEGEGSVQLTSLL